MEKEVLPIKKEEIIKIDDPKFEPSGITYNKKNNELFVVSDNGRLAIINLDSLKVEIINAKNRDYEGMSIDTDGNRIFVVEEGKDNIIEIDRDFNRLKKFNIPRYFDGKLILKKGINGLESLAFFKYEGNCAYFYSANQKFDDELSKNELASLLLLKIDLDTNEVVIQKLIPLNICDISGMALYKERLFILSDTYNRVYIFDTKRDKIVSSYEIPGKDQEGIAFDDKGNIYLAQDSGNVLKVELSDSIFDDKF